MGPFTLVNTRLKLFKNGFPKKCPNPRKPGKSIRNPRNRFQNLKKMEITLKSSKTMEIPSKTLEITWKTQENHLETLKNHLEIPRNSCHFPSAEPIDLPPPSLRSPNHARSLSCLVEALFCFFQSFLFFLFVFVCCF